MIWPFRRHRSACDPIMSFLVTIAKSPPPKPRIRIRADGWVRVGGGGFPFHPGCLVETWHWGGMQCVGAVAEYAKGWPDVCWRGEAYRWQHNISMYRIVGAPAVGIAALAVRPSKKRGAR